MTLEPFAAGGVLAHQGGWDEILLVAAPILALGGLLLLANRRAEAQLDRRRQADPSEPSDPVDPDSARPEG